MTTAHDARIAELEVENAWLRSELGLRDERRPRLQQAFRITPHETTVLTMLYSGRGRWVLRDVVDSCLPETKPAGRKRQSVNVYVCRLRKHLGPNTIETTGRGETCALRLTTAGMIRVTLALDDAGDQPTLSHTVMRRDPHRRHVRAD